MNNNTKKETIAAILKYYKCKKILSQNPSGYERTKAKKYIDWFLPHFNRLCGDDKYILAAFFDGRNKYKWKIVYGLCQKYFVEKSCVYMMRDRALKRLGEFFLKF